MSKNTVIAKNIESLIRLQKSKIGHASALAKKMGVSKTTTTALLKNPDGSNPTLKNLQGMAESLKTELWMLFVDDFPFEAVTGSPLKKISADGYTLLNVFESCNDEKVRYAMLEAAKQAIKPLDEKSSILIAETQSRYLSGQSAIAQVQYIPKKQK